LENKYAKGIAVRATKKLTASSFQAVLILCGVKFSINVPITSAGIKTLFSSFDKTAADNLHPNNRRRIIRAFEVYLTTGKTITEQNVISKQNKGDFEALVLGINYKDRELLYKRINRRVDIMMKNGLLEEAQHNLN
jgi:tRNA A37 N6-isopentenylltransferase MiaA